MKKIIDVVAITNELKGQSAFFQRQKEGPVRSTTLLESTDKKRSAEPDDAQTERKSVRPTVRKTERSVERTEDRSVDRSVLMQTERPTKRHSFEFYIDQIDKLDALEVEVKKSGGRLNKSAVVRTALDAYFENKDL